MNAESSTTPKPAVALPTTMRAAVVRSYGTPEVVSVEDIPTPEPEPGEVLVRVEASSVNALDWHFLTGTPYLLRLMNGVRRPKRTVLGADMAGTVVALGAETDGPAVGTAVFGESGTGGGFGQFARIATKNLVPIPDGVSMTDAAATPVAGLTAVQALRTHAQVQPGERVLINGAAGGVGTNAVQIAKALGAHVTAVCSRRNTAMVQELGADVVIDYTTDDFVAMTEARGERFDVVVDGVGNRSAREMLRILESNGRYVLISGPKDNHWLEPMRHIFRTALAFRRAEPTFMQFTAAADQDDLGFLGELLADGRLRPQIQRTVGLDGVAEALTELGTGHLRSKIVVIPD